MYGGSLDKISRQALHCANVTFVHPITKKSITINSPLPDDIQAILSSPK
jgi:23S rRNA pseudouridine1911/1915/1917 synthase